MKTNQTFFFLIVFSLYWACVACSSDNEEDLSGSIPNEPCDTVNITYSNFVKPLLQTKCYSCHAGVGAYAGKDFTRFDVVKATALDSRNTLASVISHTSGFRPMPDGLPKLPKCDIEKVIQWINKGAPND